MLHCLKNAGISHYRNGTCNLNTDVIYEGVNNLLYLAYIDLMCSHFISRYFAEFQVQQLLQVLLISEAHSSYVTVLMDQWVLIFLFIEVLNCCKFKIVWYLDIEVLLDLRSLEETKYKLLG